MAKAPASAPTWPGTHFLRAARYTLADGTIGAFFEVYPKGEDHPVVRGEGATIMQAEAAAWSAWIARSVDADDVGNGYDAADRIFLHAA